MSATSELVGQVISSGTPWGQIVGLAGGIFTGVLAYFQRKDDRKHEFAMEQAKLQFMLAQANADQAKLAGDLAKLRQEGADKAFTASIEADGRLPSGWKWVGGFRSATRPCLTWFFVFAFYFLASCIVRGVGMQYLQTPLGIFIFTSTANLMDLCVTWWFGQRQIDKMTIEWGNKMVNAKVSGSTPVATKP